MNIYEMTLNDYLDAASSKNPTPGGGSVSAVVAANASAMVSMVANLTLGKKGYDAVQDEVKNILEKMSKNVNEIKALTEKDIEAFQNFMEAWRLPSATEEEKTFKSVGMEKSAQNASSVPLELCSACIEILKQAKQLAPIGNKTAISDVGVGVYLADAALRSALLSVDINLPLIKEDAFKERLLARKVKLLAEADELKLLALADVSKRLL
jgi:methenyltetrahydrofolate cyclohydrolase